MKRMYSFIAIGLFVFLVSCGPRADRQDEDYYERDTVREQPYRPDTIRETDTLMVPDTLGRQ